MELEFRYYFRLRLRHFKIIQHSYSSKGIELERIKLLSLLFYFFFPFSNAFNIFDRRKLGKQKNLFKKRNSEFFKDILFLFL
jgi:hypothetical protein